MSSIDLFWKILMNNHVARKHAPGVKQSSTGDFGEKSVLEGDRIGDDIKKVVGFFFFFKLNAYKLTEPREVAQTERGLRIPLWLRTAKEKKKEKTQNIVKIYRRLLKTKLQF